MMLTLEVQTKIAVATETWRSWCKRGNLPSSWQQAWPSTRVLSQQFRSSVRNPSTASSSTDHWMPVCLTGTGQTSPSHRAKGATERLPDGPALHGRAPLSKQTVRWARSPQGNMEPVISSSAWLVHSPKPSQSSNVYCTWLKISQPVDFYWKTPLYEKPSIY